MNEWVKDRSEFVVKVSDDDYGGDDDDESLLVVVVGSLLRSCQVLNEINVN